MRDATPFAIVDVVDDASFASMPPCADPGFDHRSCDYWEDADRGSKSIRLEWLEAAASPAATSTSDRRSAAAAIEGNPFAPLASRTSVDNPFLADADDPLRDNPFAPTKVAAPSVGATAPSKLRLLTRGIGVVGSYAKVLRVDDRAVAYCQFGPLTAYPRAQRTRQLYPALPDSPLPAVITCIATTADARHLGHAHRLVQAVCQDLAERGFAAVETYPEAGARPDATSAATPGFWESVGFARVVDDDRFPVMRRDLT